MTFLKTLHAPRESRWSWFDVVWQKRLFVGSHSVLHTRTDCIRVVCSGAYIMTMMQYVYTQQLLLYLSASFGPTGCAQNAVFTATLRAQVCTNGQLKCAKLPSGGQGKAPKCTDNAPPSTGGSCGNCPPGYNPTPVNYCDANYSVLGRGVATLQYYFNIMHSYYIVFTTCYTTGY